MRGRRVIPTRRGIWQWLHVLLWGEHTRREATGVALVRIAARKHERIECHADAERLRARWRRAAGEIASSRVSGVRG